MGSEWDYSEYLAEQGIERIHSHGLSEEDWERGDYERDRQRDA